ncbi:MAG TPA: glycerophosphodiester phosphodiesterase [Thermoanaerobaculia bacterium]|nr:glycerophosphodiester phosphodiesterase [Thermoanaerobaculia bacterium]
MDDFLIFGHRGSPRKCVENTLQSFEEALRAGADGFETDLRLLADNVAVLFHDDEVNGKPVESLRSDELPAERVRALERFSGIGTMILEVKLGGWENVLLEEIGAWSNIVVASFDHALIASLAGRDVAFPLGLTISGVIYDLPRYAKKLGATWVFPDYHHVSADMVRALDGVKVVPWTPNHPHDWQRLYDEGCAGVITDVPEEAVKWRSGKTEDAGLRT